MKLRGLYAITPDAGDSALLLERAARALEGGIAALQYRNTIAEPAQRRREAEALAGLCRRHGVPFLVNDDALLALELEGAGAHLGREDGDLAAARRLLGGRLLGASCYDSLAAARAAVAAGADYIAFGSVFCSPTKPGAVHAPLALFSQARALGVPLIAIGGITLENAPQVIASGADCIAVISALFDASDVAERAREFRALFHSPSPVNA